MCCPGLAQCREQHTQRPAGQWFIPVPFLIGGAADVAVFLFLVFAMTVDVNIIFIHGVGASLPPRRWGMFDFWGLPGPLGPPKLSKFCDFRTGFDIGPDVRLGQQGGSDAGHVAEGLRSCYGHARCWKREGEPSKGTPGFEPGTC